MSYNSKAKNGPKVKDINSKKTNRKEKVNKKIGETYIRQIKSGHVKLMKKINHR
jgi:hypothetical protein